MGFSPGTRVSVSLHHLFWIQARGRGTMMYSQPKQICLWLILTLQIFLSSCLAESIKCYKTNGDSFEAEDAKICNNIDGASSMCCGASDTCLTNGLCKVSGDGTDEYPDTYWRDMCSVFPWPDDSCLNVCTVSRVYKIDNGSILSLIPPYATANKK